MKRTHLLLLLALMGNSLFARDVEIVVTDADIEIPLEGALIRSWDNTEHACDENGAALVSVPDDRQVLLQIAYPGYENGRLLVPTTGSRFSIGLHLSVFLENRELVIEADQPAVNETKSGRSVAISGDSLSRASEIGFIEDVMTSIKLLPGVGYTGMFNAQPSIRGGDPGDMIAAMDGFYIENPYHWGGAFSIFVPQMVESARLSHGIFSARYGHTISGLLEIHTKKPDAAGTTLELGVSTSEVNLGLSMPFGSDAGAQRGGIAAMGKATYWDPFIWGAQLLSRALPQIAVVNAITTAPFIRDAAITANYRFSPDLEWTATAFAGADGVGMDYRNVFNIGDIYLKLDWITYQFFGITGLTWNPRSDMLLTGTLGAGSYQTTISADISMPGSDNSEPSQQTSMNMDGELVNTTINAQGRVDFDWDISNYAGHDLLFSAGAQELYSRWIKSEDMRTVIEGGGGGMGGGGFSGGGMGGGFSINSPRLEVKNHGLSTAAYALLEYGGQSRLGAELGLRLDHFYFIADDFTLQTMPAFNPRLNVDFNVLKNKSIIDSLSLTTGTGLFSSMNDAVTSIDISSNLKDFDLKPNRSWTSLLGSRIDFFGGFSFSIDGYYKYVFDRAYTVTTTTGQDTPLTTADDVTTIDYRFNGSGKVIGFDFQLQKTESRYWDGWLSYSFAWAQYLDPNAVPEPVPAGADRSDYPATGNDWHYPYFHRFHNVNLVLNLKPSRSFTIGLRLGFASGTPDDADNSRRGGFSWPVDIKFSWHRFDPKGKVRTGTYLGIENLQSLAGISSWNASSSDYTGGEDLSEYKPVYDIPIPMFSFGFKWSY